MTTVWVYLGAQGCPVLFTDFVMTAREHQGHLISLFGSLGLGAEHFDEG